MATRKCDRKIWRLPKKQKHVSADTAKGNQHQIPSLFAKGQVVKKHVTYKKGTKNADIGGGPFDTGTKELKKRGVTNVVYDPYNRSWAHNDAAMKKVCKCGAHTATVGNVLNVIKEAENRQLVIKQAADAVCCNGPAYFWIHPGSKKWRNTGVGKVSPGGGSWQENRRPETYVPEVKKQFSRVEQYGQLIIARDPKGMRC